MEHLIREKIGSVASSDSSIADFVTFYVQVHQLVKCKREDCDIKIFTNSLHDFLKRDRTYEKKRGFFTSHCNTFIQNFYSLHNLRKYKQYWLEFLQLLKEGKK